MACTRYLTSIQELVDGTIGSIRRAELEMHLESCADCRALLRDLEKIRDAAASLGELPLPDGAWLQIAGRLRQEGRIRDSVTPAAPRRRRSTQIAILALAAALVLAVGASLVLLVPTSSIRNPSNLYKTKSTRRSSSWKPQSRTWSRSPSPISGRSIRRRRRPSRKTAGSSIRRSPRLVPR
jgi:anti-sigma factor RsiW